jgi:hypothetical protein
VRYEALYADSLQALAAITKTIHPIHSNKITLVTAEILEPALAALEVTTNLHPDANTSYRGILSLEAINCITESHGSTVAQLGYMKPPLTKPQTNANAIEKRPATAAAEPFIDRNAPFFVVGAVRSGTTMLREILRSHPRLDCPEETHFFRWADPFGSNAFGFHAKHPLMQKHRTLSGVSEASFRELLRKSKSRKELAEKYARLHCMHRGNPKSRWFDKTPQNVYGMLLIKGMFPNSAFVHIHRNPLNVVSSLIEGRVVPRQPIVGAINYWLESMIIIEQFKKAWPEYLLEISYENFTKYPRSSLDVLLKALGEDPTLLDLASSPVKVRPAKDRFRKVLSAMQIEAVVSACHPYMSMYGYGDTLR